MMATSCRVTALALTLVLCVPPGVADPVTATAVDSALLLNTLATEIAKSLSAQVEQLKWQRANLVRQRDAATGDQRHELTEEIEELDLRIDELTSEKTLSEGHKTARAICSGLLTIHATLGQAEQRLADVGSWSPHIVDLDLMAAGQIASLRGRVQTATSAVTLLGQVQALRDAVQQIDAVASTPHSKKMMTSLSAVLKSMEWIAKFTPAVEPILQQYGNAGQAMLGAAARLEARIQESQKGLFVQGRPDGGRLQAFNAQLPDLAEDADTQNIMPLPGVRDAYAFPRGDGYIVVVWDMAALRWRKTELQVGEVMRRYAFFASHGNPNPTPDEVLGPLSDRTVALTVVAEHGIVEPGGATLVHVYAERMDGMPLTWLGIKLSVREEMLLIGTGDPGQIVPTIVDPWPEDVAVWQAPNKGNSVFTITASLTDDEVHYQMVQPATCSVATGERTVIRASVEPQEVEPGGDGTIEYQVLDANGNLLEPRVPVTLFSATALEVEAGEWLSQTEARGSAAYHAPRDPGAYAVRLFFPGYTDAGYVFGANHMASQAEVSVRVAGEATVAEDQPTIRHINWGQPMYLQHVTILEFQRDERPRDFPMPDTFWFLGNAQPRDDGRLQRVEWRGTPNETYSSEPIGPVRRSKVDQWFGPFKDTREMYPVLLQLNVWGYWTWGQPSMPAYVDLRP